MSGNEHVRSLRGVRQLLADRRRSYATKALEYKQGSDNRWMDAVNEIVLCQNQINVIDAALGDELTYASIEKTL